jgi:hypothetical protein
VLDCGDPDRTARRTILYESYGFQELSIVPMRMFLPIAVAAQFIDEISAD